MDIIVVSQSVNVRFALLLGAQTSFLSKVFVDKCHLKINREKVRTLRVADGRPIRTIGSVLECNFNSITSLQISNF